MISKMFRLAKSALFNRALRVTFVGAAVAVLVGTNLGMGCSSSSGGDNGVISVPLDWRPSNNDPAPIINIPNRNAIKILVNPMDKRDESERSSIGTNRENSTPIPVRVSGSRTVADFVGRAARDEIRMTTLNTTEDMAQATHTLDIGIITFNVLEDSTFNAEVRLEAKLVDPTGKELGSFSGVGSSKTFGRSKNAENYQQTLSNATRIALDQILSDPGFRQALGGGEAK